MPTVWGSIRKTGFALAAATALVATHAQATDLLNEPVFEANTETPVEFGTGWYIRADISAGSSVQFDDSGIPAYDDAKDFAVPYSFSLGAGTHINQSFRTDITLERFTGMRSNKDQGACPADVNFGNCRYGSSAEATSNALMINGYWHFGNWDGFSPYIGGGIGLATVDWDAFNVVALDPTGAVVAAPAMTTEASYQPIVNLQIGASYRLNEKWTLDANYRASAIDGDEFSDPTAPVGSPRVFETGALYNHEVRIGLRYDIW